MTKQFRALIVISALVIGAVCAQAQNVQLHYDMGSALYKKGDKTLPSRPALTSTVEMFRPDRFGSTFFFIDIDYSPKAAGAYWEISRELNFWQEKCDWLSVHVEFNGGLSKDAGSYNNAWLAGLTYSGHSKDFSKTWSISAMYKLIPGTVGLNGNKDVHNFQLTGVWGINFAHGWCTFSGFMDFWRESRPWQKTNYIFLTEPQFWVNLNQAYEDLHLSVGTEVEISNNFAGKGFYAIPTLALKWTF